jgi:K+-transporting ATPase KdpF subunit
MSGLYILGLLTAVGLFAYLLWALFRPEDFS